MAAYIVKHVYDTCLCCLLVEFVSLVLDCGRVKAVQYSFSKTLVRNFTIELLANATLNRLKEMVYQ